MGNTGKWIKSFLTGKRDKKEKNSSTQSSSVAAENPTTPIVIPPSIPKEKRRWSFRRSSATAGGSRDLKSSDCRTTPTVPACLESEREQKKHALAVVAATVAAADAAVAAAQAAAAVVSLTATKDGRASAIKEAAAIKIQSVFRSYLARKALCALRGLVKLQALVRGHLVRKQATATLRCMQALVTVQTRARAQRMMAVEVARNTNHGQSTHRRSTAHKFRHSTEIDRGTEKNIKTVEMDFGETNGSQKSRNSYSNHQHSERMESQPRFSTHHAPQRAYPKQHYQQVSPAPSAITDLTPRTCSGHFEDYTFNTTKSSPQYYSAASKPDPSTIPYSFPWPDYAELMSYDYPLYPNYMANTESSRAKARSQSAPKQRPDSFERQPSCSRGSVEGRNVPKVVRMQRSSSHVGSTAQNYQYPWSIKLDRSNVSLKDSACGSTCSVLTNPNHCRSLVSYYVSNDQTTQVP